MHNSTLKQLPTLSADISLPSFSDNSLVMSDTEWLPQQQRTPNTSFSPPRPLLLHQPLRELLAVEGASTVAAAAASDRAFQIRVPPGFEQRFDDSPTAIATVVARSNCSEPVAVRVPRNCDPFPEFMASAMRVIPLTVGKFSGDSQLDMNVMVRILRGAADCIGKGACVRET